MTTYTISVTLGTIKEIGEPVFNRSVSSTENMSKYLIVKGPQFVYTITMMVQLFIIP